MKFKLILINICIFFLFISVNSKENPPLSNEFKELMKNELESYGSNVETDKIYAKKYFTNGSIYQQQENYAEAILEFQEALRLDSTASICYAIAQSYNYLNYFLPTIEYCIRAINLDPTFIPAYELLYNVYSSLKFYYKAYIVLEQLLELEPSKKNKIKYAIQTSIYDNKKSIDILESLLKDSSDFEVLNLLSKAYEYERQYDKMLVVLKKMNELQAHNNDVLYELIEYYSNVKNFDEAFRYYDKLDFSATSKKYLDVINSIGISLTKNSIDSLKKYYNSFIERIDDKYFFEWETQSIAGYLSSFLMDTISTDKFFERAFKLNDSIPDLYILAGIAYQQLEDYKKALEYFLQGKKIFPEEIQFDIYLVNTYLVLEDFHNALNYAKKIYENDSTNVVYSRILAGILSELKNYEESDRLFERILELDPTDASTCNDYAYSLTVRQKNLKRSLKLATFAIEVEADNGFYLDTYAWVHYQLGNYDIALEYILKAIDSKDASAEVFEHLGDIYIKLNKIDMALEAYKKSLDLKNDSEDVINKINKIKNK